MTRRFIILFIIISLPFSLYNCRETTEEDFMFEVLREVNEMRLSGCFCGEDSMPPVREVLWDDALEAAAIIHVKDMAENNFFDHLGTDGSTPYQRIANAGFDGAFVGENIAHGYVTIDDVMNQWKASPEHCKIIMDDHYYFIAIAFQDYYWVQLFGSN